MPVTIAGKTFYRTGEVVEIVGLSRPTLRRWIKAGKVQVANRKDVRGWRIFTEEEVKKIKNFAETITTE